MPVRQSRIAGNRVFLERSQIGIRLSDAVTIYRIQGATVNMARINIGKSEKPTGLTYVALSRVKEFENLYIKDFDYLRLLNITISANMEAFDIETRAKIEFTRQYFADLYPKD